MPSDLYSVLDTIVASSSQSYIATIIEVEGSAYRKEGTMMFFSNEEGVKGLISGGCVEHDIAARLENLENERSICIDYDMRSEDDLSWGQGMGCDGRITILIEPITTLSKKNYQLAKQYLEKGISVTEWKKLNAKRQVIATYYKTESGQMFGDNRTNLLDLESFPNKKLVENEKGNLYFRQDIPARPRMIVYGAGADAKPLVAFASQVGFYVIVADWRPGLCNQDHFPDADALLIGSPTQAINELMLTSKDYMVVMTHNYTKDQELLQHLTNRELQYLGLLGSKKRSERLLTGIDIPKWIYYPVGLSIEADGPEEIAISILAQMINIKNMQR